MFAIPAACARGSADRNRRAERAAYRPVPDSGLTAQVRKKSRPFWGKRVIIRALSGPLRNQRGPETLARKNEGLL